MERPFLTVNVDRRGYGRRYTWLPVDTLSREGFSIDFTGAYTQPEMIDIQPDDIVRWREGQRWLEASVVEVRREPARLQVVMEGAKPLPADTFIA